MHLGQRITPGYISSGRVAMGAEVHIGRHTARPAVLFADRADAGRALADWIDPRPDADAVVFALARGGIPVGRALAHALGCGLLPALVRKLPIPTDPEMGFGAVAVDGTVRLNRAVVEAFHISEATVRDAVAAVRRGGAARRGLPGRMAATRSDRPERLAGR
jgi:putative phosphoribosyl transferase